MDNYVLKRYFGIALDPIHVGTGGYRLGRVDNIIMRDPATNVPIIPGSTIEGITRTYAAYKLMEDMNSKKQNKDEYLKCAGKDSEDTPQCGECEICITFGFSTKEQSLHGMAQFSDAKILFFPIHTMLGPVWISRPEALKEFDLLFSVSEYKIQTSFDLPGNRLNLGWLYMEKESSGLDLNSKFLEIPQEIKQKIVLVSDKLFSQIVNSNLEIRTSVSIDPHTGAAEERALFTYEAIPRSTVFYWEVVYNNPNNFPAIGSKLKNGWKIELNQESGLVFKKDNITIIPVEKAFELFEFLGIGGMGTRGFGRLRIL